jgi:hypothetical protein
MDGHRLLAAIAGGNQAAVAQLVAKATAPPSWPVSRGACLFAAVKLGQQAAAAALLEAGAPHHFLVQDLPGCDLSALARVGISAAGLAHWSPLVIAVRQHSYDVARVLLQHGAPPLATVGSVPLLLHFAETPAAAPTALFPVPWGSLGSGAGGADGPLEQQAELESHLCLLKLLLDHGADPLQASLEHPGLNFLTGGLGLRCMGGRMRWVGCAADLLPGAPLNRSRHPLPRLSAARNLRTLELTPQLLPPVLACPAACRHPPLLRLVVNHLRDQCQQGRQLSELEARHLVQAAGRAFLGGC